MTKFLTIRCTNDDGHPYSQLSHRAWILLVAFMTMISCSENEETLQSVHTAVIAPGVYPVKWTHGEARAKVNRGDVVAVFSTASETEQSYPYTIQTTITRASRSTDDNDVVNLPYSLVPDFYNLSASSSQPSHSRDLAEYGTRETRNTEGGGVETFWTFDLSDLSTFPDISSVQFRAVLKAVGTYCDVYVDENSSLITHEDAKEIAAQFDKVAYPVVTKNFGSPPIINSSSRVAILLPLAFNGGMEDELNPNGTSTGLFNDRDQLPPSTDNPYSNYRNVLYLNPGLYNSKTPFFSDKWRPILSHEFEHMVNFRYHVAKESVPVEEGKALLSEILSGYGLPNGDYLMWENIVAYQNNPSPISLVQMEYVNENIYGSYGMGLLWMSYLYDRFGPQAIHDMATHSLLGLDATAAVTGIPKQHLFTEWVQANIVSNTTSNKIFSYKTIDIAGNGGGNYFDTLKGFGALPQHSIPYTETQRQVHSFGVEYFTAIEPGIVIIKGNNIQALIICKKD